MTLSCPAPAVQNMKNIAIGVHDLFHSFDSNMLAGKNKLQHYFYKRCSSEFASALRRLNSFD